ncbi:uncharacterized protein LOC143610193 [Bidens hawaiensis]|uniref:uncharacterized protein LOC143610193 n=1 Tax=Bidens hawaiensis TaxID=980011 RepID=UPI00404AD283
MGDVGNSNRNQNTKENSSTSLICPMLTSTNYTIWAMKLWAIFNVHGVWEMIDPGTSTDAKNNNMAIALLFQSISEAMTLQVGNLPTAKEMWDTIKARHLGADRVREARLQTLMDEFDSLKMKESSTVDEFASQINTLASKAASLGETIEESKMVKRFLSGLPKKNFIHMVASIEQLVNLKTVGFDDVVGRLKAYEERIKDEICQSEGQGKLMFHKAEYSNRGQSSNTPSSRGRGRSRETGGRGTSRNQTEGQVMVNKDRSQIKCFRCDEMGHFASSCPERRRANQEANLAETNQPADRDPAGYLNLHEIFYLNEERVNPKSLEAKKVEEDTWYLDNGASNHMTVGKGTILFTSKTGDHRVLSDVYFIPSLKSNIISLGQATENGCDVRMKKNYLLLYDGEGKLMMKVFRTRNRLYTAKLIVGAPVCLLSRLDDPAWLWHARMGHLNFEAMKALGTKNMEADESNQSADASSTAQNSECSAHSTPNSTGSAQLLNRSSNLTGSGTAQFSTQHQISPFAAQNSPVAAENSSGTVQNSTENLIRKSTRMRAIPLRLNDYVIEDGVVRGDEVHLITTDGEPGLYSEAKGNMNWERAMKQEIKSIEKNKTWSLVNPPNGAKTIGLKWVFKIKRNADGTINKYKARLVAKGYVQQPEVDFEHAFAPVARLETVRLLIALADSNGWDLHHLDVKSAFLHGELKEEVYVLQPEGF